MNLGLAEPIVRAVTREGYTLPTPIQSKAIPHIVAGSDLLGCARTGTGKTAAFALPMLHRLHEQNAAASTPAPASGSGSGSSRSSAARLKPRALILAPTRELASQIADSVRIYGKGLGLRHTVVFGGVNQNPQVRALRDGVDILIATPGRLMDLMQQGHIDLSAITMFVLDEADRMLDMGFINDIRKIVARVPEKRQTLLFSATMPRDIRALADSILRDPVSVHVDPISANASVPTTITQSVYLVPRQNKTALLKSVLRGEASGRTLVFTRTKHGADKVVRELLKSGIRAAAIHGNKNQNARTRALADFKSKSPPVLVATDIASRGIDVDDVTHVINFDMPHEAETYVHRIGRTARAGASGAALSFCDREEHSHLRAIECLTGTALTVRTDQPEHATDDETTIMAYVARPARSGQQRAAGQSGPRRNRSARNRNGFRNGATSDQGHSSDEHGNSHAGGKGTGNGNGRKRRPTRRAGAGSAGAASHASASTSGAAHAPKSKPATASSRNRAVAAAAPAPRPRRNVRPHSPTAGRRPR